MDSGLNPRFDGAFLNCYMMVVAVNLAGLNPRFDGAFLNSIEHANSYMKYMS